MINNQNIAVLSEKVAALEAAIKNAGIELPSVTADDNGKTLQVVEGAWATGGIIPALVANPEGATTATLKALELNGVKYNFEDGARIKRQSFTSTTNAYGQTLITAASSDDKRIPIGYSITNAGEGYNSCYLSSFEGNVVINARKQDGTAFQGTISGYYFYINDTLS